MPQGVEGTGYWTTNAYGEPEWIEREQSSSLSSLINSILNVAGNAARSANPSGSWGSYEGDMPGNQYVPGAPQTKPNADSLLTTTPSPYGATGKPDGTPGGTDGGGTDVSGALDAADAQWMRDYLAEHGGVVPRNWDEQRELRDASAIWAAQHGNNPYSWGNRVGDNRVPQEIFKRLNTARSAGGQSGYKPTLGQIAGWATDADELGGAYMAMRGERYHPVGELETETKKTLLNAILGAYRR